MFLSIALIHSSAQVVPMLTDVAHDVVADVELIHMVDESIQRLIDEAGEITEPVVRRLCSHALNAQEAEAEAVMLTAPSISQALDAVRAAVHVPVVHVNEAMVDAAARLGSSVGVLAEDPSTLEPTLGMLLERANEHGKELAVESKLCEEAARARMANDFDAYDRAVLAAAEGLTKNDIIILTDIMMERVVHEATEKLKVPVLTGPRHGFEDIAKRLNYFRR
jgi:aspartate/glutamate racemase